MAHYATGAAQTALATRARELYAQGLSLVVIAKRLGLSKHRVGSIIRRSTVTASVSPASGAAST